MTLLDGFDYAEQALPHAPALARRAGAQVHLVHVLDMLMRPPYAERVPSYEWWNGAAIDCARDYLRVQSENLVAAGVDGTHTVLTGKPAEALVEEAKRRQADLIVMATHGRGPLRRLWLGSVTDQLSRTAGRPIMFVRVSGEVVPVPPPKFSSILVALLSNALADAEIVNYARTNQVDLIALATQGRGVLRRVLAGSVSDRTLQHAEMPVLLLASEKQ